VGEFLGVFALFSIVSIAPFSPPLSPLSRFCDLLGVENEEVGRVFDVS